MVLDQSSNAQFRNPSGNLPRASNYASSGAQGRLIQPRQMGEESMALPDSASVADHPASRMRAHGDPKAGGIAAQHYLTGQPGASANFDQDEDVLDDDDDEATMKDSIMQTRQIH